MIDMRALMHAAALLQDVFYAFRYKVFDYRVERVYLVGSTLVVREAAYDGPDEVLVDFPYEIMMEHSFTVAERFMTMMSSKQQMIQLHQAAAWLFVGKLVFFLFQTVRHRCNVGHRFDSIMGYKEELLGQYSDRRFTMTNRWQTQDLRRR